MAVNNKNRHHRFNPPAVEVAGDKEVLASAIEGLGLPDETLALLKNNKFNTVYDIAKRTERDMFRIQTFNKKHLVAVKKAINAKGIDFLPFVPKEKPDVAENQTAPAEKPAREPRPQQNAAPQGQRPPRERGQSPQNPQNGQKGGKPQNGNNNARPQGQNNRPQQNERPQNNNNRPQQGKPENRKPQTPPEPRRPRVELPLEEWEKVCKNGKWGFSNGLATVIQPQFDEVFCFKDGLACVDVGEKFGYIDQTGEFVITPQYECSMSFSEGMAVFFEGEKCGYINKQNEVVIPAKYDAATAFVDGRAKVKEAGKWQTIDPDGNTLWTK